MLYACAIAFGVIVAFMSAHSKKNSQLFGGSLSIGDSAHADAIDGCGTGGGGGGDGCGGGSTGSCGGCGGADGGGSGTGGGGTGGGG